MRKVIFAALCVLAVFGCKKNSNEVVANLVVTGDAVDLTPFSATLIASYNPMYFMEVNQCGIYGSTEPGFTSSNYSFHRSTYDSPLEPEYRFEITGLEPGTTYYYRAYMDYEVSFLDKHDFGEIRQFTTPPLENVVVTESPDVASNRVRLRGTLTMDFSYRLFQVWFMVGKDGILNDGKINADMDSDGSFSLYWGWLDSGSNYCYKAGITYEGEDYTGETKSFRTADFVPTEGDSIDMGLSVKWCSHNVGTSSPDGWGDFFAWGETAPKDSYTSENYSYSSEYPAVLPLDRDAANASLGGSWRMPTRAEVEELVDPSNTIYDSGSYNGVRGIMFYSNKNGNRVFFPASGFVDGTMHYEQSTAGYYRTASRDVSWNDTIGLTFNTDLWCGVSSTNREQGYSVRGVCE